MKPSHEEPRFKILNNEPRIVTKEMIETLKESGASQDLIDAAERAERTNPTC